MPLPDRLYGAMEHLLAKDDGPPDNVRSLSRLTPKDVESFHRAADSREHIIFMEMEALLLSMRSRYPVRASRMIKEIRWLRGLAHDQGLPWGKQYKWWKMR